ncbi:MAG TPA: sulfur carrier protein ThiS [Bacteroidales bacterium]|jgi:thiamine biosynthesis protein ThiS|nr:sulfur carrier protein ThiS [Bacteroidales bacterium]
MNILLNNRKEEFEAPEITVKQMLEIKKFTYRLRIVKVNNILIPKERYESTVIHDGDNVQMLYLMSGG